MAGQVDLQRIIILNTWRNNKVTDTSLQIPTFPIMFSIGAPNANSAPPIPNLQIRQPAPLPTTINFQPSSTARFTTS